MTFIFDILIIGGGHAGVEAALIAKKGDVMLVLFLWIMQKQEGSHVIQPLVVWVKLILLERWMLKAVI